MSYTRPSTGLVLSPSLAARVPAQRDEGGADAVGGGRRREDAAEVDLLLPEAAHRPRAERVRLTLDAGRGTREAGYATMLMALIDAEVLPYRHLIREQGSHR